MHVLIVEDEPEMARLLARGLEEEQFEVSVWRATAVRRSSCPRLDRST